MKNLLNVILVIAIAAALLWLTPLLSGIAHYL